MRLKRSDSKLSQIVAGSKIVKTLKTLFIIACFDEPCKSFKQLLARAAHFSSLLNSEVEDERHGTRQDRWRLSKLVKGISVMIACKNFKLLLACESTFVSVSWSGEVEDAMGFVDGETGDGSRFMECVRL